MCMCVFVCFCICVPNVNITLASFHKLIFYIHEYIKEEHYIDIYKVYI